MPRLLSHHPVRAPHGGRYIGETAMLSVRLFLPPSPTIPWRDPAGLQPPAVVFRRGTRVFCPRSAVPVSDRFVFHAPDTSPGHFQGRTVNDPQAIPNSTEEVPHGPTS